MYLLVQKIYQYYLLGFSNVYQTLYVQARTIYVRIRTGKNILHINLGTEKSPDSVAS